MQSQLQRHLRRIEDGVLPESIGDFSPTTTELRMAKAREDSYRARILSYAIRRAREEGRTFSGPREATGFVLELLKRAHGVYRDGDFVRGGWVGKRLWWAQEDAPRPARMLVVVGHQDNPEPPRAA